MGDFTSIARGKRVHRDDFVSMAGCRLPSVVMGLTLTAGEPDAVFGPLLPDSYDDMLLRPDLATLAPRPGRTGELTVLCEPAGPLRSGAGTVDASAWSPRAALRAVLARLDELGLQARVAPELELFLLQREPGSGALQSARAHARAPNREQVCEALSLERLTHFEPYFDELASACAALGIPFNGHAHESALSQFEVNFRHGEPLAMADAVFRFKRLAREVAARQGLLCSFAPKPFLSEPGTGTHWHLSLQHQDGRAADGWPHLFARPDGSDSAELGHFIAGLQAHAPAAMALFAPHDMAFDRIALSNASPSHANWGHESRALAFRIPASGPGSRRVENRLPGGDANPYLTLAATLGLGLSGLLARQTPLQGEPDALRLPTSLPQALDALTASRTLRGWLGDPLVDTFVAIKRHEHAERAALADPRAQWDLTHLVDWA